MGLLDRLPWRRKGATIELWRDVFGSPPAKSGQTVTAKTALQVMTVLACVRVKANGLAQVPLKLIRETDGAQGRPTKLPAKDHPLYDVLHRRPNPWQTSFEFRQTLEFHRQLCGNAFCFINRVGGRIVELIPIEPNRVVVKQNDDLSLTYTVTAVDGSQQPFPPDAIWHLKGPSWNSWMGLEIVKLAREAIGLAMATEEAHARLHANGVMMPGLYSFEGPLDDTQYKRLRAYIEQEHAGSHNAGRPFILDRGAKWVSQAMSGVDAEHLATRKFQIEEVCRALNVFPQMVGYSDKAPTYASAEQFFGAHVVHTMGPEYEAWEQSIDCNLLTEQDRRSGLYAKFFVTGLLRGAIKDRGDFYTKLYGIGALNPNEIRELEDLNPYEGGERYRVPLNMTDPNADPDDGGGRDADRPFR